MPAPRDNARQALIVIAERIDSAEDLVARVRQYS
jgi:hypothetical protein